MRLEADRAPSRARVSLTPLVDVVFLLLIFFMLASSLSRWQSIPVSSPSTNVAANRDALVLPEEPMLLRLRANGSVDLNGRELPADQLRDEVLQHLRDSSNPAVVVRPAGEVALQAIVTVLDDLRRMGVTQVSLVR